MYSATGRRPRPASAGLPPLAATAPAAAAGRHRPGAVPLPVGTGSGSIPGTPPRSRPTTAVAHPTTNRLSPMQLHAAGLLPLVKDGVAATTVATPTEDFGVASSASCSPISIHPHQQRTNNGPIRPPGWCDSPTSSTPPSSTGVMPRVSTAVTPPPATTTAAAAAGCASAELAALTEAQSSASYERPRPATAGNRRDVLSSRQHRSVPASSSATPDIPPSPSTVLRRFDNDIKPVAACRRCGLPLRLGQRCSATGEMHAEQSASVIRHCFARPTSAALATEDERRWSIKASLALDRRLGSEQQPLRGAIEAERVRGFAEMVDAAAASHRRATEAAAARCIRDDESRRRQEARDRHARLEQRRVERLRAEVAAAQSERHQNKRDKAPDESEAMRCPSSSSPFVDDGNRGVAVVAPTSGGSSPHRNRLISAAMTQQSAVPEMQSLCRRCGRPFHSTARCSATGELHAQMLSKLLPPPPPLRPASSSPAAEKAVMMSQLVARATVVHPTSAQDTEEYLASIERTLFDRVLAVVGGPETEQRAAIEQEYAHWANTVFPEHEAIRSTYVAPFVQLAAKEQRCRRAVELQCKRALLPIRIACRRQYDLVFHYSVTAPTRIVEGILRLEALFGDVTQTRYPVVCVTPPSHTTTASVVVSSCPVCSSATDADDDAVALLHTALADQLVVVKTTAGNSTTTTTTLEVAEDEDMSAPPQKSRGGRRPVLAPRRRRFSMTEPTQQQQQQPHHNGVKCDSSDDDSAVLAAVSQAPRCRNRSSRRPWSAAAAAPGTLVPTRSAREEHLTQCTTRLLVDYHMTYAAIARQAAKDFARLRAAHAAALEPLVFDALLDQAAAELNADLLVVVDAETRARQRFERHFFSQSAEDLARRMVEVTEASSARALQWRLAMEQEAVLRRQLAVEQDVVRRRDILGVYLETMPPGMPPLKRKTLHREDGAEDEHEGEDDEAAADYATQQHMAAQERAAALSRTLNAKIRAENRLLIELTAETTMHDAFQEAAAHCAALWTEAVRMA